MGTNFYAHVKAKYKQYDYKDPVSVMYEELDDDPKVTKLTNGYVWNNTYYKNIDSLNKDYYHVLHIGKSSFGWHFSLCIYPAIGINSLEDWKKVWSSGSCKIYTEYDEEISEEEIMSYIVDRQYSGEKDEAKILKHNNDMAEKEGIGHRFSTYEQYMSYNGAMRGKNGLWAHRDPRYLLTDNTYDLTNDVNFW